MSTGMDFTNLRISVTRIAVLATIWGYCNTGIDGGGWLVVLRRHIHHSQNFHRIWNDYEKGIGHPNTGEMWYGLRALHCLTQQGKWELRIDFGFSNGTSSFMHYNDFKVGPATDNYRLSISGFIGVTPTDPFTTGRSIDGQQFSTRDRDNNDPHNKCLPKANDSTVPVGWWNNKCFHINLNEEPQGVIYLAGKWYYPLWINMKIRPRNCEI